MADNDKDDPTPASETLPPGDDESAIVDPADLAETAETPALEPDAAESEAATGADTADPDPSGTVAPPETAPDSEAVAAAPGATAAVEAAPAKTARRPRTDAQKAKRKADDARRKDAIKVAQANRPPVEDDPEAERKAAIREELEAIDADMTEAEAHLDKCKARTKELISELYPAMKANDRHVDAVRGYVKSQKDMRANRALAPARLKAMLEQAGKAPIDAAFSTQRARGFSRPTRKTVGIPEGDAAGSQE